MRFVFFNNSKENNSLFILVPVSSSFTFPQIFSLIFFFLQFSANICLLPRRRAIDCATWFRFNHVKIIHLHFITVQCSQQSTLLARKRTLHNGLSWNCSQNVYNRYSERNFAVDWPLGLRFFIEVNVYFNCCNISKNSLRHHSPFIRSPLK